MKKILLTLLTTSLLLTSCGSDNASTSAAEEQVKSKTPEELKAELAAQEKSAPLTYLTLEATMQEDKIKTRNEGLFRSAEYSPDGNTIYMTITNSATIAKYKDIVVTVTFYSQTETAIESKDFTFYEFFEPNSTKELQQKVYPPELMEKFGCEIKNATAAD